MRISTSVWVTGSLLLLASGCDLLKRKANDDKGSAAASASGTAASGTQDNSGSTNTTAATPENDPSKGATVGCTWPESTSLNKDITFTKGCSLVAKHDLTLTDGATATFEEGVKIAFDTDGYIWVDYGKVIVKGTAAAPVTFTSANKSPAPGDWVGIGFREKTMAGTSIDHLVIEYAGSKASNGEGAIRVESMRQGGRVAVTNSIIRDSAQFGLVADENATFAKFENNSFKDNKSGSVNVVASVLGSVGTGNTFTNPIHVKESRIEQNATWPAFDVPVIVDGHIIVQSDSTVPTLTIADKTTIKMAQSTYFDIQAGAIVAKNVTFTSAAPSPSDGDWVGFFIRKKSNGTHIENCTFEYFGDNSANGRGALTLWGTSAKDLSGVTIANNTFRHGKQAAMASDDNDCSAFKGNKVEGVPFCKPPG